uniref:NADH dehydrogenase subunit 6 n=1 Tax=Cirroctopus glacialis TaxID=202433 RepID=UPI0022FD4C4B|nr:NADH dehydrogenase subunit 6 [Cirroctopus glacialis]WAP91394.1 NADH dehydrogenase subunit 6 [Cirroctopus glacialis]
MSLMMLLSVVFAMMGMAIMMIQPLSLGMMVVMVSITSSILVSFLSYSWYGYMMFLVYIGGMMVMFMYVVSLIPNNIFLSMKSIFFFFLLLMWMMCSMVSSFYMYMEVSVEEMYLMNMSEISLGNSGLIMVDYNYFCYVLMGVVLLLVLISVVKICYYCEGPLREFKYKYA